MTRVYRAPPAGSAKDRHRDALAQRYVMDQLAPTAKRAFEAWMGQDARLHALVRSWEHVVAQLSMHVPHMAPSPALWRRIQAELPTVEMTQPERAVPWWASILRSASLRLISASAVGALAMAVVMPQLGPRQDPDAVPASYVGVITDAQDRPALVVASLRHGRQVQVKLVQPIEARSGFEPVLWALVPGGAPRAVGRLPVRGKASLQISLPADRAFDRVTRLAVSLEPVDGSQSGLPGKPGSDFILSGHCAKVW